MLSEYFSLTLALVPLAAAIGLFVGSFLNVVIYRVPRGLSVSAPRSFCPTCDRQLAWWENVPVVSWVALRGRCRTCHQTISFRYPLVEAATGATFAMTTWALHGTVIAAAYCLLASTLIAVGLIEYSGQRAPVSVVLIGAGIAQVIIVLGGGWQHRWTVVVGSLVGTALALGAVGLLRSGDLTGTDPRGHGRGALLLLGCWAGGLGLAATIAGAGVGILVYSACLAGERAMVHQTVPAGGSPALRRTINPVVGSPLVTAIAVAMVVSLAVGG